MPACEYARCFRFSIVLAAPYLWTFASAAHHALPRLRTGPCALLPSSRAFRASAACAAQDEKVNEEIAPVKSAESVLLWF